VPTNRRPRHRERFDQITPAALELFAKLESIPQRRRNSQKFRRDERTLANMLDLTTEWWGGVSVVDFRSSNPFRPWQASYQYWFKCRTLRRGLLALSRQQTDERASQITTAGSRLAS
jgi:hypothetical protein